MTGPVLRSAVLSSPVPTSRWHKIRTELSLREQGRLAAMFLLILVVNAAGWGIYVLCVMPHHFSYQGVGGSRGLGVGLGVAITAWFLGFRHAFDADHISCIDNTTRKLMANGRWAAASSSPSATPRSSSRSASASPSPPGPYSARWSTRVPPTRPRAARPERWSRPGSCT
jgi:hypothetical protein